MEITSVKVRKVFEEGTMKAIVSVTLDDQIAIHDIKVIYAGARYFVVMPSRKLAENSFRDIAHPINSAFRSKLETAVIEAYFAQKDALLAATDETYAEEAPATEAPGSDDAQSE